MDNKRTGVFCAELDNFSKNGAPPLPRSGPKRRKNKKKIIVSIIIPAKNEEQNIGKNLQAICDQDIFYSIEILVIDSGSTDNTAAIAAAFPQVKLLKIDPREFGHGKTRNLGAGKSKGDYIVFLNADAIPVDKNWLKPLIESLESNNQAAGVYSRHIPRQDCHLYMARDLLKSMPPRPSVKKNAGGLDFMIFSTVSAAVKREIWEKYPFDDDIIIAEDQDWAKKVLDTGYHINYEPASMVYHSHNFSLRELFSIKARIGRTEKKFRNRFAAVTAGFFLVLGGAFVKFFGDIFFILFKSKKVPAGSSKIKQLGIAAAARVMGFAGRYAGWSGAKNG